ncbi:MAG: DUF1552 domain-containing protein [Myxococcaceae bacterium]|nr:DUF1552 domain-containing protein [Myxococcaceae bacterium]
MSRFTRRRLLGAGGVIVALPFLESLLPRAARAQPQAAPPRRVLWVFTANGDQESRRFSTRHETNFVLDEFLAPYQPHRADMLFVEGVDKYHYRLPAGQRADGHQQGGSALAPWRSGSGSFPIGGQQGQTIGYVLGPSIDRVIGERVQAASASVRFAHFNFRVGDRGNNIWNQHSHRGPQGTQSPIPPETDPFAAYTRIFASVDPAAREAALRRLAMRQSALDAVKAELAELGPRLSVDDRRRLELHAESVRELERSLSGMAAQVPQCTTFTTGAPRDPYDAANWWEIGRLFAKISAMAFACDLTRSINFNWSGNTSDRIYRELGHTEGHHTISHDSSATAFGRIRQIMRALHQRTVDGLYAELKAIPEGQGQSVYDNTLIVHWSELAQGDTHGNSNNLVMFGGGAKRLFRTGRFVNLAGQQRNSFADLLVPCFHFMGFTDVTSFGDPLLSQGGLPPGLV